MEQKNKLNTFLGKNYKRWWFLATVSVLLSIVYQLISFMPLMGEIEDKTLDYRFKLTPIPHKADSNIVMVAIDGASLKFAQELRQGWPFPREFYGIITQYLAQQGAKAVIYDMQFYEPDFDRADINSEESDGSFASAMQNAGNVIIGCQLEPDSTEVSGDIKTKAVKVNNFPGQNIKNWQGVQSPITSFLSSAKAIGMINVVEDKEAIVRRMPLLYRLKDDYYPSLAFSSWLQTHKTTGRIEFKKGKLIAGSYSFPMDKHGLSSINWYGKGDVDGVFKYYSFASVLQSAVVSIYQNGEPALKDGLFKDKYVIIGAKAAGLMDLKSTPYTWSVPGMEIWATILSNLNQQDFVRHATLWLNLLIIFVLTFVTLIAVTRLSGGFSTGLMLVLILLQLGISLVVFRLYRYSLPVTIPFMAIIVSWIMGLIISYIMEGKHKRELRQIFNRYLHPDLVQRIVDNPEMVQMGGEDYLATVMFSDIYNFTGFSENKTPSELVSYLNEYFSTFTNMILDCEGLLDKYTGDGLMAVFGVPIARGYHADLACKAALEHRDFSLRLKSKAVLNASDNFHLNTRLGIHSGHLVAGNIGSSRRLEFTSIGDTVNLSARLEGVNKVFHTYIIISEATYLLVKDRFACRELDFITVKGKKEPTRIYELIAEIEKCSNQEKDLIAKYKHALEQYRSGLWQAAKDEFEALCQPPYNDKASETMLKRCAYLVNNPPQKWDGIWILEDK